MNEVNVIDARKQETVGRITLQKGMNTNLGRVNNITRGGTATIIDNHGGTRFIRNWSKLSVTLTEARKFGYHKNKTEAVAA